MKRIFKSIFVVFVALTMLFGISATAIADDATVVFKSAQEGFDFGGGSEYGGCAVKSRRGGFGEEHHDQEDRQCCQQFGKFENSKFTGGGVQGGDAAPDHVSHGKNEQE